MTTGNGLAPGVAARLRTAYGLDGPPVVNGSGKMPRPFSIVGDDQLENMPEPEWLVDGILPANGLAMLYGAPEAGKSFLAVDMALAIASQPTWHGRPVKDGSVVYVAAEGAQSLKRRVAAWKYVHDFAGCAGLFVVPEAVQLMDDADVTGLLTAMDTRLAEPPALLMFDTLQRCMSGGDENNQGDAGKVIGNLDFLRKMTGATCLLIHHPGTTVGRPRGSTVFAGAMDAVWELREDDSARVFECKKLKDAPHFDAMRFALQPTLESCVLAQVHGRHVANTLTRNMRVTIEALRDIDAGDGALKGEWCKASGLVDGSFHRAVKDLREAGYVEGAKRSRWSVTPPGLERLSQLSLTRKKVA
jgi:hypothetical protein